MADNPDYIGYGVGGLGLVSLIAQGVWAKFFSTEGKANDALVEQLNQRITAQELRLSVLEGGLDEERKSRRLAEDKVHALQMDNVILRAELLRHGIKIPPPMGSDDPQTGIKDCPIIKAGLLATKPIGG